MLNIRSILREMHCSIVLGLNIPSKLRLASDVLTSRLLKWFKTPGYNSIRQVLIADGIILYYRMNRGDIQGIREVWMDNCYAPPAGSSPSVVVDLGGNIGLASLWMHWRFHCDRIVVVEPDERNAEIIEKNFAANRINGHVIQAAVGPTDGEVFFTHTAESNMGHVAVHEDAIGQQTSKVRMVSMDTVLREIPATHRINLLKLDIEGGEGPLFDGDLTWLERVDLIVAELHPDQIDGDKVCQRLFDAGFYRIPKGTISPQNVGAFVRHQSPSSPSPVKQ